MTWTTTSSSALRDDRGGRVHLTRRGRFVVVLGLVGLLLAAFSLGREASEASPRAAKGAPLEQVVVHEGESLWTIAQRIAPENDPRQVVAQIRRLNDLDTAEVAPGQQLVLPRAA